MVRPTPPKLAIPASTAGSPSANSATTQTGRPSMWTKSAQRKMTRLYVYTTLPFDKIVELVHSHTSGSAPGRDSAHKKLNHLLDKEPRWLHPRSHSDMGRRVNELANSSTRLRSASNATFGHSRSIPNTSTTSNSPQAVKMEDGISPTPFETMVPNSAIPSAPLTRFLASPNPSIPQAHCAPSTMSPAGTNQADEVTDAREFSVFLRQTTCLSNSTNLTTGSFHRVLSDYSEPYVQTVKRLVKHFTAPKANRASLPPTFSDEKKGAGESSWVNDEDCPPELNSRPFAIPGDYLSLDEFGNSAQCHATHEAHCNQRCLCFADYDFCVFPWVNRKGLTPAGQRVLRSGPTQNDASLTDSFGNTVLHFLAARGSIEVASQSLQVDYCRPWIEAKNSAGQTFLHVLDHRILEYPEYVCSLLAMLSEKSPRLIHSRDCYGRSFLHLLCAEKYPKELLDQVAVFCDQDILAARDAFGFSPAHAATGMELDRNGFALQNSFGLVSASDPRIARESKLLENVRLAGQCPSLQGDHGRNGLHCLAMASLSSATVVNKYHLQSPPREKITKRHQNRQHALDSSTDKLNFRLGLVIGLLHAGVDPNQHDNDGNTPLMAFVAELPEDDDYKIPPQILEALVNKGADVNARNRRGETALHVAVRCGRKLATRTLVRLGANVHARDSAGRSLLDIADVKMVNCESDEHMTDYAHFEACRAWLSGKGMALQRPTVIDEWGI